MSVLSLRDRKMPLWFGSAGDAFKFVLQEYLRMWGGHSHEESWWARAEGRLSC